MDAEKTTRAIAAGASDSLRRQLRHKQRGLYGDIFWRDNDFQPLSAAFDRLLVRTK